MNITTRKIGRNTLVRLDVSGLKNLLDGIDQKYVVRVGILGSKAQAAHQRKQTGGQAIGGGHKVGKEASPTTNAEIGLAHEKGVKSRNLPRRSWLQTPLEDNLGKYFGKLGEKALAQILVAQPRQAYVELGIVCEQIVLKGFETGGYGKWRPLKAATIAAKGSDQILVDTAQLKKSVTSAVVEK